MSTIEKRRNGQYRAKVRRYGISQTKTFETRRAAEDWATQVEGRVFAGEVPVRRLQTTTLEVAIEWFLDRVAPRDPDQPLKRRGPTQHARNQVVHGNYWLETIFAEKVLHAISKSDLDEWRRAALDEDNRDMSWLARTVPLFPSMVDLLVRQLPARADKSSLPASLIDVAIFPPKTGRGVTHAFSAACKAANPSLTDLHFHDLPKKSEASPFWQVDLKNYRRSKDTRCTGTN